MNPTASFYSRPSYVSGGGQIYIGARRQRGGSILGALKSVVAPLISNVGRSLKRNVLSNAVGFAGDVASDLSRGRSFKSSLLNRGKERGLKTLKQTFAGVTQGKKSPKRMKKGRRKHRGAGKVRSSVKRHSRKRRRGSNHSSGAKRRRCYNF